MSDISGVDKIVQSNKQVAEQVVFSNELVTDKLIQKSDDVAEQLRQHNITVHHINEQRFREQKRLSYIAISLSLATLLILIMFSILFFKYAIIVRVGTIG